MARPLKNNADYFPHETGMRDDSKLKAVKRKFGLEGYAIYVMLLEALTESECLQIENTEIKLEILAGDFGIETDRFTEILGYFCRINLIQMEEYIRCKQLDRRLSPVFDKRKVDLDGLRRVSDSETPGNDTENPGNSPETDIVKKSKGKESKGEEVSSTLGDQGQAGSNYSIQGDTPPPPSSTDFNPIVFEGNNFSLTETDMERHRQAFPSLLKLSRKELMKIYTQADLACDGKTYTKIYTPKQTLQKFLKHVHQDLLQKEPRSSPQDIAALMKQQLREEINGTH